MNAENGKTSALVPRSPVAVEKVEPGAKRVLALMVSDTLAIAQKHLAPATTAPTQAKLENWFQQGLKHYYGKEVPQNYPEATNWFCKAAEQGHAEAQYYLGLCYGYGHGAPQDYTEAVKWYREAAEQGHAEAQYYLGTCYSLGQGVQLDDSEAAKWFREAAEQGDAEAQFCLGWCYYDGGGVPQDHVEAYKWFKLAAEMCHSEASDKLESLSSKMTQEQIAEGERRYTEFEASHQT